MKWIWIQKAKQFCNPNLTRNDYLSCIISGLLLVLSFPPFEFSIFIFVALSPALHRLPGLTSKKQFAYMGFFTGLAFHLPLLYWLIHVTLPGWFLLSILLSVFWSLTFIALQLIPDKTYRPFCWALIWALVESMRSLGYFSFAWGYLGHSLVNWHRVSGFIVPWVGVPGLSFIIFLLNIEFSKLTYTRFLSEKQYRKTCIISAISVISIFFIESIPYNKSIESRDKTLTVALLQGNFEQEIKESASSEEAIDVYLELSADAMAHLPDLLIWPESSITVPINYSPEIVERILEFVNLNDVEMLVGTVYGDYLGKSKWDFHNRAILFTPDKKINLTEYPLDLSTFQKYDKMHLVPYGEWVPFYDIWPFMHIETLIEEAGAGIFQQGETLTLFELRNGLKFSVSICFESTLSRQNYQRYKSGADFIVNITNDAWFKRSAGLKQHFIQCQFRAMEINRPVLRAANTGITASIDQHGQILDQITDNQRGYCITQIQF